MKSLLKASSIINLIIAGILALLFLMFEPVLWFINGSLNNSGAIIFAIIIIFMFTTGVIYNNYSKLDIGQLYQKKDTILVLAIITLLVDFVTSILLFIAHDQIIGNYKNAVKNKTIKENKEPDKSNILLKLGIYFIAIAGLMFATTSWQLISNSIKVLILLAMGIIFVYLSYTNKNNLKRYTNLCWILGITFLILTVIGIGNFQIFGEWFSFMGNGSLLFIAFMLFIVTILSFLTYKRYKDISYSYLTVISLILTLCFILSYMKLTFITITLIISLLMILSNLLIKDKKIKKYVMNFNILLSMVLSFDLFICLLADKTTDPIISFLTTLSLITNLFYNYRKKNEVIDILSPLVITLLISACVVNLGLNGSFSVLIAGFVFTSLYLTLIFNDYLKKSLIYQVSFGVILNLSLIIVLLISFNIDVSLPLLISIFLLIPSLANQLLKSNLIIERYSLPLKIVLLALSVSNAILEFLPLTSLFTFIVCALAMLISYLTIKDKHLSFICYIMFNFILIITLYSVNETTETIPALIVLLISFFPYVITKNIKKPLYKDLNLAGLIIMLAGIYQVITSEILGEFQCIDSLLVILAYLLIMLINNHDNVLLKTTSVALIIPLGHLVNKISCIYPYNMLLSRLLIFYIVYLVIDNFINKEKIKNTSYIIISCILLASLAFEQNLIIGIFVGVISLGLMIVGINNEKYKGLFITGLVFLLINLFVQLGNLWGQIPFWIYLLIIGLILIFLAFKSKENNKN